jgi:serine/threonine protein kinase
MWKNCRYVGYLPRRDPLHHYLQSEILPLLGHGGVDRPSFRVFHMDGSNEVYLYEEKSSRARVVGKFFKGGTRGDPHAVSKEQCMLNEFNNLQLMRSHGLTGYPHDIVRPLGYSSRLNSLLVEEYRSGQSLSDVITQAILQQRPDWLYEKLTALAYFLATFHNRTANGRGVSFHGDCAHLDAIVGTLFEQRFIHREEVQELSWLSDRWREQPRMWEDQQVLVHGDATPSNFLFGKGLSVVGIDLENMRRADRVFNVGRISGELQHFFLQIKNDKQAAEPFIGHFLWEYACHFPDRDSAFRSITRRVPFQMGLTLLRIARNSWISHERRRRLIEEAKTTLRTF